MVFIYVKAKSVQGWLLLPEVLYLSRASWGHFCGPPREGGEGDNGAILEHKLPVSHPVLHSAFFLIIMVCVDLTSWTIGIPSTDILCFLLSLCLWKGHQNRKARRAEASCTVYRHSTNFVQWLMGYMKSVLRSRTDIARSGYYTSPKLTAQIRCLQFLYYYCKIFSLGCFLPSFLSLGTFIWTWNFFSISENVGETPKRRSNGSPSARSWAKVTLLSLCTNHLTIGY